MAKFLVRLKALSSKGNFLKSNKITSIAQFFSLMYLILFFGMIIIIAFQAIEVGASETKILITANQVEFDPQNEKAVYTGDVTVKQDTTTLQADRIEVYFLEKGKGIELIKVFGNIRVTHEDKIITADEGIYYHRDRKIVLTGNPMTRQGENWIAGEKIVYFWDQGKAIIEGKVKAVIIVDEEKSHPKD